MDLPGLFTLTAMAALMPPTRRNVLVWQSLCLGEPFLCIFSRRIKKLISSSILLWLLLLLLLSLLCGVDVLDP